MRHLVIAGEVFTGQGEMGAMLTVSDPLWYRHDFSFMPIHASASRRLSAGGFGRPDAVSTFTWWFYWERSEEATALA
jgi:hypothetical protein